MSTSLLVLLCLAMLSPASAGEFPFFTLPSTGPEVVPGQYIILLKEDADATVSQVLEKHQIRSQHLFERLHGFRAGLSADAVAQLRQDPQVELVEPDYIVHALSFSQTLQALPSGINRSEADISATAKIDKVDQRINADIAIIDTGVDNSHKDLYLYRSVNFSNDLSSDDRNGHGSHVAGTAAALDNSTGVVGIAPGARIWSVKVLDRRGSGYMSDIIAGIDYVTANAAEIEVANMSLGCNCTSAALNAALDRSIAAGVVYAVAAGNDGRDAATYSPANHPDVITVSAIADFNGLPGGGAKYTCYNDKDDTFANFSNYGAVVDIAAPGVCITSSWDDGRYSTISGTSMASPHVAGAVALYLSTRAKPTNASGVAAVSQALKDAGTPQASAAGFTEDRDSYAEPLLNVSTF